MKKNDTSIATRMGALTFDGTAPIRIVHLLTKFADAADTLKLSEHEAYLSLKHFIKDDAATLSSSRSHGRSPSPPKTYQILRQIRASPGYK